MDKKPSQNDEGTSRKAQKTKKGQNTNPKGGRATKWSPLPLVLGQWPTTASVAQGAGNPLCRPATLRSPIFDVSPPLDSQITSKSDETRSDTHIMDSYE